MWFVVKRLAVNVDVSACWRVYYWPFVVSLCTCVSIHGQVEKVGRKENLENNHFMASNSIFESVSSYQSAFIRGKCTFLYVCAYSCAPVLFSCFCCFFLSLIKIYILFQVFYRMNDKFSNVSVCECLSPGLKSEMYPYGYIHQTAPTCNADTSTRRWYKTLMLAWAQNTQ